MGTIGDMVDASAPVVRTAPLTRLAQCVLEELKVIDETRLPVCREALIEHLHAELVAHAPVSEARKRARLTLAVSELEHAGHLTWVRSP